MKKITICGSSKNYQYICNLATKLKENGFYVFIFSDARHLFEHETSEQTKYLILKGLKLEHFDKIKKADIVLFANLEGHMGNSATMELGFAVASSKTIIALNHDNELARECMLNQILETEDIDKVVKEISEKFG